MTEVVLGFEVGELIIIYAVFFGAALAKGVTGLGFSTACLPFLAFPPSINRAAESKIN